MAIKHTLVPLVVPVSPDAEGTSVGLLFQNDKLIWVSLTEALSAALTPDVFLGLLSTVPVPSAIASQIARLAGAGGGGIGTTSFIILAASGLPLIDSAGNTIQGFYAAGPTPGLLPPVNTSVPTISGTPQVGVALTASTGTWVYTPTLYAYQWKAAGANVGINAATYTAGAGDVGKAITVTVTATNVDGFTSATSAATAAVLAAPAVGGTGLTDLDDISGAFLQDIGGSAYLLDVGG